MKHRRGRDQRSGHRRKNKGSETQAKNWQKERHRDLETEKAHTEAHIGSQKHLGTNRDPPRVIQTQKWRTPSDRRGADQTQLGIEMSDQESRRHIRTPELKPPGMGRVE